MHVLACTCGQGSGSEAWRGNFSLLQGNVLSVSKTRICKLSRLKGKKLPRILEGTLEAVLFRKINNLSCNMVKFKLQLAQDGREREV